MGHISKQVLVSAMLAAAVYTGSASLAAQEQGAQAPSTSPSDAVSAPRPRIDHNATVQVSRGDYGLRIFFQENRTTDTLNDSHVFYEPLIYLLTNDQGRPLHRFDDDANWTTLTLYFRVETEEDYIEAETRKELAANISNKSLANNLRDGSIKFNLTALPLQEAWFESTKRGKGDNKVRSEELAPGPVVAKNNLPIHFRFPTRQEAEAFVDGLFDPPGAYTQAGHNLVFRYRFSGVGREQCNGRYKAEYAQASDFDKELTGTGGEGNVTRDQAVKLADKVTSKIMESITCSDPGWATYIHGQLINRLGGEKISLDPEGGWEQLDRYMKLDEDSFKADLTRRTKDIKKKAVRDLVSVATSEAWSKSNSGSASGGVAAGWGPFMASATGSFAEADSRTGAEATNAFFDIMRKSGIFAEWDGEKYVPKSVEVYNEANMRRNLSQDFKINYTFRSGDVSKSYAITLTSGSFTNNQKLAERLRQRIRELKAEKEAGITQAVEDAEKARLWAEAAVWDARKAIVTASNAEATAARAEATASNAEATASNAEATAARAKSIVTSFYRFESIPDNGKFVTKYKISSFPFAHIARHRWDCSTDHRHRDYANRDYTGLTNRSAKLRQVSLYGQDGFWTIYVEEGPDSCRSLELTVAYYRGDYLLRTYKHPRIFNWMKKHAKPMERK